jgi:hypothetical protein
MKEQRGTGLEIEDEVYGGKEGEVVECKEEGAKEGTALVSWSKSQYTPLTV